MIMLVVWFFLGVAIGVLLTILASMWAGRIK